MSPGVAVDVLALHWSKLWTVILLPALSHLTVGRDGAVEYPFTFLQSGKRQCCLFVHCHHDHFQYDHHNDKSVIAMTTSETITVVKITISDRVYSRPTPSERIVVTFAFCHD